MADFVAYDRTPLWAVFWLYGVAVSFVLMALIGSAFGRIGTPSFAALLLGFFGYTVWIVRKVWVHAFNVRNVLYGHIARALTVAWPLNAMFVAVFVLIEHVEARALLGG